MKRILLFVLMLVFTLTGPVFAQKGEPTVYVIKKGDTLWGLSARFLKDPHYWPNLWSRNQEIQNPHFIYPGQKVRIYEDRIVVEEAPAPPQPPVQVGAAQQAPSPPPPEVAEEQTFMVTGGEGFLMEKDIQPVGHIVATDQNRVMVGKDDPVFIDIGRERGAKAGSLLNIYRRGESVSHPVTNVILGDKVIPLGVLRIAEVEDKASLAIITESYLEIGTGSYLMPYHNRHREISLKAADRDLNGFVVGSQTGNISIGAGEVIYLDLGKAHGVEPGNLLYVVRDVNPDMKYSTAPLGKLPVELLGAVVVLDTGTTTSTALVVKSVNTIYRGDMVELRKSR